MWALRTGLQTRASAGVFEATAAAFGRQGAPVTFALARRAKVQRHFPSRSWVKSYLPSRSWVQPHLPSRSWVQPHFASRSWVHTFPVVAGYRAAFLAWRSAYTVQV